MLSDDSSSDSETGRFKGQKEDKNCEKDKRTDRNRNDRSAAIRNTYDRNREYDRKRNERNRYDRDLRDSHRSRRHSPHRSRDRLHDYPRRSKERYGHSRDYRPKSREQIRTSHSRSAKSPERRSRGRDEKNIADHRSRRLSKSLSPKPYNRKHEETKERSRDNRSPEYNKKRSVVCKPHKEEIKKRSPSPIVTTDIAEDVQPGSYYDMKPTLVKEQSPIRSEDTSEIDSSDDVKLRAKLLNLERELNRTKKKKHKKKHKRNKSKSKNDNECDIVVSSTTTDMQEIDHVDLVKDDVIEVTSTDNYDMKESNEEGEISSDDLSKNSIDPADLRLKLKRTNRPAVQVPNSRSDVCGPALPPHLQPRNTEAEGPALPPKVHRSVRNIGPSIPNEMRKVLADSDRTVVKYESSDDDGIGPLPAGDETKWTDAHQKLEERALDIKIRHLDGHTGQSKEVKVREKWMLELPEGKAKILGLEARSFRAKEGPDMSDRSTWTDTPEQKALKAAGLAPDDTERNLQEEARSRHVAIRDDEQEKAIKKHKKKHKRDESLLEMHEKKLKKKKKKDDKDSEKKERRPFSRDLDLQVNRFDEAQKKSIIKKAQQLDTRFSRGEAKYL